MQQGAYKSFSACCAALGHTPALANSCGCNQEEYINKSFNSVRFRDVTSAAPCIAKLRCTSPNGASACCCLRVGDATFEICHPAVVLVLWVRVWSDSFLLAPWWISVCITQMWICHSSQLISQAVLGNTRCPTLGHHYQHHNPKPFVVPVDD